MGDRSEKRCQKVGYPSRKKARRAIRRLHPADTLRAYRCQHCDYWHAGHNPPAVKQGIATAVEYYAQWPRYQREATQR